jgi:hypothetical protein
MIRDVCLFRSEAHLTKFTTTTMLTNSPLYTRRSALRTLGCGFGQLALAGLLARDRARAAGPLPGQMTHFPARAKRIIFLFMQGGVSHVDSFDYKPRLIQDDGKLLDFGDLRSLAKTGKSPQQRVMRPLWEFSQHGQSGLWASRNGEACG